MDVKVKQVPARIGAGLSVQGYAIICDSQIREWFQSKEEADRIAGLFKDEATNPEDY
tara:strand:- start:761 stop:931 length:171 start_codon:yes stop_codon:yes gene_type:complete